jgi:hypothetical protein
VQGVRGDDGFDGDGQGDEGEETGRAKGHGG